MRDLSDLSKKCLSNMPILLDVILSTREELSIIFASIFDDMKEFIEIELSNMNYFKVDEDNIENENTFILEDESRDNFSQEFLLTFSIPFYRIYRAKETHYFEVVGGYQSDEDENIIYYELKDYSVNPKLTELEMRSISTQFNEKWKSEEIKSKEEQSIWIGFDIDDTLSAYKIQNCANDFKKYILKPFLDLLKDELS